MTSACVNDMLKAALWHAEVNTVELACEHDNVIAIPTC